MTNPLHVPHTKSEAEENLRAIRELMERPTRHSTFSGLSGVMAGCASLAGCFITFLMQKHNSLPHNRDILFLLLWAAVVFIALLQDFFLTKRPAAKVGKVMLSSLGRRMFIGAMPGLCSGALLTLFLWRHQHLNWVYPVWMLCYGCAVCSVALFSQSDVLRLGCAFLAAGAVTLIFPAQGLLLNAVSFGGFHILYGVMLAAKERRSA